MMNNINAMTFVASIRVQFKCVINTLTYKYVGTILNELFILP